MPGRRRFWRKASAISALRILHVAHGWPPANLGGTELYAAALADAQRHLGHTVEAWWGAGLPPKRGFRATFDRPDVDATFAQVVAETRPDIVHIHHLTGLSFGIPAAARSKGARVVFTLHDAWLACARGQFVDRTGERCPGPSDDRCARCLLPRFLPVRPAIRARRDALDALIGNVDRFLTPSRHLPARIGIEADYLPLPLLAPVPPAPPSPPGSVRFLFLGGLIPTKGPLLALEAFARLPAGAGTLRIVGPPLPYDGRFDYVRRLRARVREVPGATLLPPVPPEGLPALLGESDVLVFPSTWEENSPLVLREAAAAGLRIVASDVPGVAEVLGPAPRPAPGSIEALAAALAAEVRRGRARGAPRAFPDMATHAGQVVAVYRSL